MTDVDPVLRPLEERDLDALLCVQEEGAVAGLGHIFPKSEYPFPTADLRRRWAEELADPSIDCFAVVDDTGGLAGFAATRGDQFLHFGTALSTWGSGLAGQAHDEVVEHLAAQGYESAWLRVFQENQRARRFYERRGWTATGERARSAYPPQPVLLHYARDLSTGA